MARVGVFSSSKVDGKQTAHIDARLLKDAQKAAQNQKPKQK